MSVKRIQIGQLWKKEGTGDTYLVTRVYTEALTTLGGAAEVWRGRPESDSSAGGADGDRAEYTGVYAGNGRRRGVVPGEFIAG